MDFTLRLYEPRFNFAIQELFYAAVHNIQILRSGRCASKSTIPYWRSIAIAIM